MSWTDDLAGFDTESSGRDPLTARLVTASVVRAVNGAIKPWGRDWLVAVDDPIPAEATAVHGVTTEYAQGNGRPLMPVVREISITLCDWWAKGTPAVIYNAPYDLLLINQERVRCGLLALRFSEAATPILDPLVIDRAMDKYRKGSRKLGDVCKHYGVTLDDAHTSAADSLAAVEVMLKLVEAFPKLRQTSLQHLYRLQAVWYAQWASNYQDYKRREAAANGSDSLKVVVDQSWPVRIPVEEPLPVGGQQ